MTTTLNNLAAHVRTVTPSRRGYCLNTVMRDVGASYGQPGGASATAMTTYLASKGRLHATGTPPKGALVLFDGGSRGFGHVGLSWGGGRYLSVDWHDGLGQWVVPIAATIPKWRMLRYRGWSGWYGDQRLHTAADPVNRPNVSLSRLLAAQKAEQTSPRAVKHYPAGVLLVERAFHKAGLNTGPVDGHAGLGFTDATRGWQHTCGDPQDGRLGPKQFARLAKASGLFDAVA